MLRDYKWIVQEITPKNKQIVETNLMWKENCVKKAHGNKGCSMFKKVKIYCLCNQKYLKNKAKADESGVQLLWK